MKTAKTFLSAAAMSFILSGMLLVSSIALHTLLSQS